MWNKHEVSESKYWRIVQEIMRIHTENGVNLMYHPDEYGMNQYYKSDEGIEISFYWNTFDKLYTPDGSISIGSKSCTGNKFPIVMEKLIDFFGLELVSETDPKRVSQTHEKWKTYRATKNI